MWTSQLACPIGLASVALCLHKPKHVPFLISQLQPSDAQRTRCLALAIADILWRAGGKEQAVVAL